MARLWLRVLEVGMWPFLAGYAASVLLILVLWREPSRQAILLLTVVGVPLAAGVLFSARVSYRCRPLAYCVGIGSIPALGFLLPLSLYQVVVHGGIGVGPFHRFSALWALSGVPGASFGRFVRRIR